MENTKVTAEVLAESGWTEAQIDRYYELLDRHAQHGPSALTLDNLRFIAKAAQTCGGGFGFTINAN